MSKKETTLPPTPAISEALRAKDWSAHITKIVTEPVNGFDAFKLYTDKDGTLGAVFVKRTEPCLASFKDWTDLFAMAPKGAVYEFEHDEQPIAYFTTRANRPVLTQVQIDYKRRAGAIDKLMQEHGIPQSKWNTHDNRTTIRAFFTTAAAKAWALDTFTGEKTVTDTIAEPAVKSEVDEFIKRSSITRTQGDRANYFARRAEIYVKFNIDPGLYDDWGKSALGIDSHDDWTGTQDEALHKVLLFCMDQRKQSDATMNEFKSLLINNGAKVTDFKAATGFANRQDAYDNGKKPSDLYKSIQAWLSDDKKQAQEGPSTEASAMGIPEGTPRPQNTIQNAQETATKTTKDKPMNEPLDIKEEIRRKYNQPQRGKDYLMVQGRVLIFRVDHPDWTIETDHILLTEDTAVFKATIRNAEGRVIASGHGKATEAGTKNLGGRYIEKAETAAIGRALALAGFGTDDSLDDGDYLADSPVKTA